METPILTPMQQAIERLQIEMQKATEQQSPNIASGFHHSITILKTYLPKEQGAIKEAYAMGSLNKTVQLLQGGTKIKATEYFNQTYKETQNKQ
jgi:hypothetical protein